MPNEADMIEAAVAKRRNFHTGDHYNLDTYTPGIEPHRIETVYNALLDPNQPLAVQQEKLVQLHEIIYATLTAFTDKDLDRPELLITGFSYPTGMLGELGVIPALREAVKDDDMVIARWRLENGIYHLTLEYVARFRQKADFLARYEKDILPQELARLQNQLPQDYNVENEVDGQSGPLYCEWNVLIHEELEIDENKIRENKKIIQGVHTHDRDGIRHNFSIDPVNILPEALSPRTVNRMAVVSRQRLAWEEYLQAKNEKQKDSDE